MDFDSPLPPSEPPAPIEGPPPAPSPVPPPRWFSILQLVLCSGVPTQTVLTLVLFGVVVAAGGSPCAGSLEACKAGRLAPGFLAAIALGDTGMVVALMWWFLRMSGERPAAIFFGHGAIAREALIGVAVWPAALIVVGSLVSLLRFVWPALHNVTENPFDVFLTNPGTMALLAVTGIVAGGVREELQRGFMLHRFQQGLGGRMTGLVITSVAFGAGHYTQGFDVAISLVVAGAIWGALTLARRSVTASMTSHACFDAMQVVAVAVFKAAGR